MSNQVNDQIIDTINDLMYEILLIESELKNCENQELGETLFNELLNKKTELAVLRDTTGF